MAQGSKPAGSHWCHVAMPLRALEWQRAAVVKKHLRLLLVSSLPTLHALCFFWLLSASFIVKLAFECRQHSSRNCASSSCSNNIQKHKNSAYWYVCYMILLLAIRRNVYILFLSMPNSKYVAKICSSTSPISIQWQVAWGFLGGGAEHKYINKQIKKSINQ